MTSLGHRSKFQRVSHLGFVTAPTSLNGGQPNFARCLAVSWSSTLCILFWGSCSLTKFCHVQNSLCVQVLRSPILAALLHGTRAVGVSQSLRHGTRNGITELSLLVIFNRGRHLYSEGGHHVGHRPTLSLISICHPLLVVSCNDRMGAGDATTLTQALLQVLAS